MVPSASLQYRLFSDTVEYRKSPAKRLQNHRTAKVGTNIWRSCYPLSCPEQAQPEQAAQGQSRQVKTVVQLCPGYLQEGRLHKLAEKIVPVFGCPQSCEREEFFLLSAWTFWFVLICLPCLLFIH